MDVIIYFENRKKVPFKEGFLDTKTSSSEKKYKQLIKLENLPKRHLC